jgi:hypothetical protein
MLPQVVHLLYPERVFNCSLYISTPLHLFSARFGRMVKDLPVEVSDTTNPPPYYGNLQNQYFFYLLLENISS